MPFTFAHAAAVLPALRTDEEGAVRGRGQLVAAALVAGSLAPDVPFFAESVLPGAYGLGRIAHRTAGVAVLDPLFAAGLAAGWAVVRGPLIALLPPSRQGGAARLLAHGDNGGQPSLGATAGWFWASAAAGAATHVAVDAFTHPGRWGVRHLPVLQRPVRGTPLYDWAQYATSAAGLTALALHATRTARRVPQGPPPPVPRLTTRGRLTGAATLGASAVAGAAHRCVRDRPRTVASLIGSATFGAGAGLALCAPAVAAAVHAAGR